MRTPAENYFGSEGFAELLEALTKFGQETLGCTAISPPWLSVYVDGCEQRYHTDSWHGPWAFVLSLTGEREKLLRPVFLDASRPVFSFGLVKASFVVIILVLVWGRSVKGSNRILAYSLVNARVVFFVGADAAAVPR